MSEKIKAIRGSKERAEEVKQWLIEHGAKYFFESKCNAEDFLYCVTPDGYVNAFAVKTSSYLFDVEELPRWRAEKGQMYYYISDLCNVIQAYEENESYDDWHHELGNYFQTRKEAEEMRNKIVDLFKQRL